MGSEATTRFNLEAFEIIRLLQTKRSYDLLHGFFLYPAGFLAVTVARWAGIRSIVSIRGNDVGRNAFDPQLRTFISATLEHADYVTSVTTGLLEFADKTLCSVAGKSRVILNSFDASSPGVEAQTELVPSRLVIGAAGVFRYKKGLIYLFKALSNLQQSHDFSLLLVGGFRGAREEEIHLRQLGELNLTDRTTITGMITHAHLLGYLDLFDVLVFPSLFSEGCPMVMLEAMSRRRAIIASRSGAIPEVIVNEESGLLFDVGNSRDLEKQICRLLNEPELRRSLGENAYRKSLLLSPAREQEAWLGAYHQAIAR
jgi:glycosyltransferase involved in cell wall biosynthesis